ncbi:MAG: hypothetical protein EOP62_19120 [Sphingomonadales bacterium]|nr:MAG: hypothetical protein EOP62_19120 [Sphingomonadales bacterium]
MTKKSEIPTVKKAECGKCAGSRNCDINGHHQKNGGDRDMQWTTDWYLLRCRGCEHVFVQTVSTNSQDVHQYYDEYDEEQYAYDEEINYWPALSKRAKPSWLGHISGKWGERAALKDALNETYGALEGDLHTLAAIGIRTSFDVAAELLGIDPGLTFSKKLDELVTGGHIGTLDRSRLETLVEAGSASAHRGWRPSADDVSVMMEALQHFIHAAFVAPEEKRALDAKVAVMKGKVPARQKPMAKNKNKPLNPSEA